jgi:N-methylhydantoinase A/oxoprolinase/acetone carboxylase beta subunit
MRLGIDTGGTYTDAVLVDERQQIVASAKCLTTRHELTTGIGNALAGLPDQLLREVGLVALSTTLSTNSVVEGRGAPVCVLLPGYKEQQVRKSGLLDIFDRDFVITLPGGHDAVGAELEALDEQAAIEAIDRLKDKVSAFAISAMFGVRNPAHELRLRELIEKLSAKPVTCGHELASDLDAPRRALTVGLNARMVPTIHELIIAVREIMEERGIQAPLMMVKGNGSLINTATALKQPVGTVLSGPAASVIGGCALSGASSAIIADMGGTTTDIAVVNDGRPELDSHGVRIGDWRPMVEAVRVFSVGLGGDSEVRFSGKTGIEIGPRRAVPMSLLADQHPQIIDRLRQQLDTSPNARNNRFAMRLEHNEVLMARFSEAEERAWAMLDGEPVELESIVGRDRDAARALAGLQRKGLVIYSGFTPTDAAHVLGLSDHWCVEAARLSARIWARQMRHVYGLGRWADGDATTPSRDIFDKVTHAISQTLVDAGLHQHDRLDQANAHRLSRLLADLIVETGSLNSPADEASQPSQRLFKLSFAADHPLVAVGAPASTWYPQAAERLGMELKLPQYAGVANAYGAVMGSVVQRAHVTITQPRNGRFMLYSREAPQKFGELREAISCAESIATEEALELALAAGAVAVETRLSRADNHVKHDIDGELFLETRVTATASGRPAIGTSQEKRLCG